MKNGGAVDIVNIESVYGYSDESLALIELSRAARAIFLDFSDAPKLKYGRKHEKENRRARHQ